MASNQEIFNQVRTAISRSDWSGAEKKLKLLLRANPNHPEFLHLLGITYLSQNRVDEGIGSILKAISKAPRPHYYINLGRGYMQKKNWKEAITQFKLANGLSPHNPEARFHLALAYKGAFNFKKAEIEYKKTLKLKPDHAGASYNLGNLYMDQGRYRESKDQLLNCIKHHPRHFNAHNNVAATYEKLENFDQAEIHYKSSIAIQPSNAEALRNLSLLLNKKGDDFQSKEIFEQLMSLPRYNTRWHKLHKCSIIPKVINNKDEYDHIIDAYKEQLSHIESDRPQILPEYLKSLNIYPSSLLTYSHLNLKEIKSKYGKLFYEFLKPMSDQLEVTIKPEKPNSTKTKVGLVVTSGHEGVFLKCMRGMIDQLDKDLFDLWFICSAPLGPSIIKEAIQSEEVNFLPISKDLLQNAKMIKKEGFDFLYYWEIGTDNMNYFLPHFRLAQKQVTSWGWPITSGIPNIDYYLSCESLETENASDHYSEELVLFKKLPTYYHPPSIPVEVKSRADYGLSVENNIYLCVQNIRKIHPDMDNIFQGIVSNDPNAHLVFAGDKFEDIDRQLDRRLSKYLPEEKFTIFKRLDTNSYFQLLQLANVVLDTFPYTGGANTCGDALACGVPYVTLEGKFHRSRFGSAVYKQIGVTELIASDIKEYIDLAIKTANDNEFKKEISNRITSNKHLFFEDKEAVVEFQDFLLMKEDLKKNIKIDIPEESPTYTEGVYNKASKLFKSEEYDQAIELLESIESPLYDDLVLAARIQRHQGKEDAAINTYLSVIEKFPDEPYPYKIVGSILEKNGNHDQAKMVYQKAIDQELKNVPIELQYNTCMPAIFSDDKQLQSVSESISNYLIDQYEKINHITSEEWLESTLLVLRYMLFHDIDRRDWKEKIAEIVGKNIPVRKGTKKNNEKPRIGFLVTRGHEKIFARSNKGLLNLINKDKYEVIIISPESTYEWIHQEIEDTDIRYIPLKDSLSKAILDITLANLDVLYHWEVGTDSTNYILSFYRLASVQVTSWGVHCTSGIKNIDYFLSSRFLEPPDGKDHYSEELVMLDSIPTYYYKPEFEKKAVNLKRWGIEDHHHIYFCNQTLLKIQPKFDKIIRGILEEDEDAIIIFIRSRHTAITKQVEKRWEKSLGSLKDRTVIIPYFKYDRYMSFLNEAHVIIDTLDFSGANTSYEAFSLGKPVITLDGKYSNGRYTSALYKKMGLEDMVAKDISGYISMAVKVGMDEEYRNSINEKIITKSSILWQEKKYIEEFEAFIDQALENL